MFIIVSKWEGLSKMVNLKAVKERNREGRVGRGGGGTEGGREEERKKEGSEEGGKGRMKLINWAL